MKVYPIAVLGAIVAPRVLAHQIHGILIVNGTATPEWKYIRDVAWESEAMRGIYPDTDEYFKTIPQMDFTSPNITCGRLGINSARKTETADVLAGSVVGFRVSCDANGPGGIFWHPGPGQIYLSRAPNDNLESYVGDGDWFKIAYAGPVNNTNWQLWGTHDWNFTIPKTTPPGKYLLRIEHIMPTPQKGYNQWYVNCAHVNIIGPGGGKPTGFAKFPGTYTEDDPGILIPDNQDAGTPVSIHTPANQMRLLDYRPPGPAVWTG